jgi:hypothetical protein
MNTDGMDTSQIDPRLKELSYSTLLKLHSCPRKFELYRKKATENEMEATAAINQNITFAFGHIVGDGIQQIMCGASEDEVIFKMFCDWHADLADINPKQLKSFYHAVLAVQTLINLRQHGFLEDYEVLIYNGKPAVELSFCITFPDGFRLRGYVDAVLRHKETGAILVLECKTSSAPTVNPTIYKNSAQAIGYSVVLDVIAPDVSSYDVLYLVYLTNQTKYETYRFPKTYLQRAIWIQELLLDIETIKMYEQLSVYPMRGESCSDFNRDCEYLAQCNLSNKYVTLPLPKDYKGDIAVYDINLTLLDLITAQLDKNTSEAVDSEPLVLPQMDDGFMFDGELL